MGILLVVVRVALGGPLEAAGERDHPPLGDGWGEQLELLEVLAEDGLHAPHAHQIEGERALTGELEAVPAVALSEPQELLGLAEPGSGDLAREESLGEAADLEALLPGLADQALGVAERAGGELGRRQEQALGFSRPLLAGRTEPATDLGRERLVRLLASGRPA